MPELPPPDPREPFLHEGTGLTLSAPTAVYLDGRPRWKTDRVAHAILDLRPGALIVVASD